VFVTATHDEAGEEVSTLWTYKGRDTYPIKMRETGASPKLAIGSYRSDDYLALFDGDMLYLFSGQFPSEDNGAGLNMFKTVPFGHEDVILSSKHRFFTLRSGNDFLSYDIETENVKTFNLGEGETERVFWLNDYLFCTNTGNLTVYDFDGDNEQELLPAKTDSPAVITPDHKYLYFVEDGEDGKLLLKQLNLVAK
jgi:hypothetical protein